LRRVAREKAAAAALAKQQAAAEAKKQAAQQDPYADPAAPYKADRLASPKFSEPIANTPKSITVLTREVLEDKDATSLKDVARTTAGVTIGTGEGGNAFGDRFFIRGFDARNDVFVDGIRDPAVNIRENFFTEQIEILKGPSSTIDGRGTTGGALNIVTKQATTEASFYNADSKFASDNTKRVTFDVNQVINPTLAIRMDGMWQNANISERDFTTDDRWGGLAAVKWTPTSDFSLSANFIHTYLNGLPDFGVPYDTAAGAPVTSVGVPRQTYYGFVNRDFQIAQQDIGTLTGDFKVNDYVVVTNKFSRAQATTAAATPAAVTSPIQIRPIGWSVSIRRAVIKSPTCWPTNRSRRSSSTPARFATPSSPARKFRAKRSAWTPIPG
jgi:catecholate siderophore receptor